MSEREMLLNKLSTYQFAALDLQLYLNTHPGDKETIEKMNRFDKKADELVKQYEEKYGPLTKDATEGNNWSWIKAPWPWESEADC